MNYTSRKFRINGIECYNTPDQISSKEVLEKQADIDLEQVHLTDAVFN